MTNKFTEVHPEDFMKIGPEKLPHVLIEQALLALGKRDGNATFKKEALKLAGWNGGALTTYASRAQKAADAFNRIRTALEDVESADELKAKLSTVH